MPTLNDIQGAANASSRYELEKQAIFELHKLKQTQEEQLAKKRRELQIETNKKIFEEMARLGATAEEIQAQDKYKKQIEALDAQFEEERKRYAELQDEKSAAEFAAIEERYRRERKTAEKNDKDLQKKRDKAEKKTQKQRLKDAAEVASALYSSPGGPSKKEKQKMVDQLVESGLSETEAKAAVKKAGRQATKESLKAGFDDLAKKLATQGEAIAKSQTEIDTRLQGLNSQRTVGGSYWRAMNQDFGSAIGASPYIKQEDVVTNLKTLVGRGIAANVEQRAFLMTLSDKIATTFDAADASLVKLVRIHQADTTAARLGMESALTSFLNNMYETTEYMTEAASSIRANIYEASALMGATEATAFEYQVQKWLGSLYSVGFTNADGLAGAFGKLAAGDISGVTDGGYGNLLVMAANQAGLQITDILKEGLDDSKTNRLFSAMVEYLAKIYGETQGSNVLAQQFANVYGLTASDLKAAANLKQSMQNISSQNLDSNGMLTQLTNMANTMHKRTSTGELMHNALDNLSYTMAEGLGNNPALFATYNIANMLEQFGGGINLPFISALGTGVDLNATVAQLMKIGAVSGSVLSGVGKLISSFSNGGGFSGSGLLNAFGVGAGATTVHRGTGSGLLTIKSGKATSSAGYIGNESSEDVQNKSIDSSKQDAENQLAKAVDEQEGSDIKLKQVDEHIEAILNLLNAVTNGTKHFRVELATGTTPNI